MKRFHFSFGALCLLITVSSWAANPAWWTASGTLVIDSGASHAVGDNYAPANLGQLKNVAKKAKLHLDANLPGGAGSAIDALINSFEPRSGQGYTQPQIDAFIADNYAPINLGQLKAVAKPFYDRLQSKYDTNANLKARGFPSTWSSIYPWDPATPVSENYTPANIGQLKMVFSFDLDTDSNGLPDWWELRYYGALGNISEADADGDGLTNLEEYQQGSDPNNYFSQGVEIIVPVLVQVEGSNQDAPLNSFVEGALIVEVRSGSPGGPVLINASVKFTIVGGDGQLAAQKEMPMNENSINVRTDSLGRAKVFLMVGSRNGLITRVDARCQDAAVEFSAVANEGGVSTPPPPRDLSVKKNSDGTIDFSWTDVSSNETYFFLERQKADGSWERIATVPADTTNYHYTPLP